MTCLFYLFQNSSLLRYRNYWMVLLVCQVIIGNSQTVNGVPDWVKEDWTTRVSDGGKWIADNSSFKNEQEPFDAYVIEWFFGIGDQYLKGHLYGLEGQKESEHFWEYIEYWDPTESELKMIQIGGDGTTGQGSILKNEDGRFKEQLSYIMPDGTSFETGHHAWMQEGTHHTQSFQIVNGEWIKARKYIWRLVKEKENTTPYYFEKMQPLIGEWAVDLGAPGIAKMQFKWGEYKRLIYYKSLHPAKPGELHSTEAEGIIVYDGVADQIRFHNAYMGEGDQLISDGTYTFQDDVIERKFICRYGEGEGLPWSNGQKAPAGGKEIEFKQVWQLTDANNLEGRFYKKSGDQWVAPDPANEGKVYKWRKIEEYN